MSDVIKDSAYWEQKTVEAREMKIAAAKDNSHVISMDSHFTGSGTACPIHEKIRLRK